MDRRVSGLTPPTTSQSGGATLDEHHDPGDSSPQARQGVIGKALSRLDSVGLVAACVLFTVALRLPYLTRPLLPDEAGLLIIAQNWSEGPFLYGDYFIGRGIVLMLIFVLGDALGGAVGIRLLACVIAALMVIAAGWAGHQLRGRAGAGWAALVAAAYSSTYALSAEGLNERLVAATFVMGSCALTLAAVRHPRSVVRAVLAGVLAALPLLVVQSYADALLFAPVVLFVAWRQRSLSGSDAARIFLGGLVGMLLTAAGVAIGLWATWMTASQMWFQTVGYRVAASRAVGEGTERPGQRLVMLLILAALMGVLILLASAITGSREVRGRPDLRPVWWATMAMFVLAILSMMAGGDWWHDYLLQPIPGLAMAAALVAPSLSWSGIAMRTGAVVATVAAVVSTFLGLQEAPILGTPNNEAAVGRWVAAGAESDDTALVLWGRANVLYSAEMLSPYPYMWSLLTRTLDKDLDLLLTTMRGPDAPTWVVRWHDVNSWELDSDGDLAELLEERYVAVGTPCGIEVFLLRPERRDVPPSDRTDPC